MVAMAAGMMMRVGLVTICRHLIAIAICMAEVGRRRGPDTRRAADRLSRAHDGA
jgi:hypothetical protein